MSVPENVRRRFSTMFVEHRPFGYEETDDRADPKVAWLHLMDGMNQPYRHLYCPRTPRRSAQATPTPEQKDVAAAVEPVDVLKPCDVVPALFSSPRLNSLAPAKLNNDDIDENMPRLPELVADVEDEDDRADSAIESGPEAEEKPAKKGTGPYSFMRCPQCQSILKWLFVDEYRDGEHKVHRCKATCICEQSKKVDEPEVSAQPVQVNRGAW